MNTKLQIELLIFSILFITIVLLFVRNNKLSIRYALVWLFAAFLILLSILVPGLFNNISKIIGFGTPASMIIFGGFVILIYICFSLTIIVSGQANKIRLLIQEISLLKSKMKSDKNE